MATRNLAGCRALVTGASAGIGRAVALELAEHGADLLLTARREERLRELATEIVAMGRRVSFVAGDITDADLRRQLIDQAQHDLGGLDLLVNNAGSGAFGPFVDADEQRLRRIMEVNFFAPVELIRAALPVLRQGNRPLIVNVGSVLGHCAVPDKSEYCASKYALHGFTDALREELSAEGIDVLLVSPSTTDSEFFEKVRDESGGDAMPVSSLKMSPEAVARAAVKAIRRGRREVILSTSGKLLVWSDRLFPSLVSWLLSRKRE